MRVITPDDPYTRINAPSVFLAGTIDNGASFNWQQVVIEALDGVNCVIFNPRKTTWDASLDPRKVSTALRDQVDWERSTIISSSIVFFHFAGGSVSPISLLEYGMCWGMEKSTIVSCSADYFRFGNVRLMQDSIHEPTYTDFNKAVQFLKQRLSN